MNNDVLKLPLEQLGLLYPYYLVLSTDETIIKIGPRLQDMVPLLSVGDTLPQWFSIAEPRDLSMQEVTATSPVTMMLASAALPVPLKGTLLFLKETHQYLFLGGLWVRELEELAKTGLKLKDIPQHDSTLDHLLALQAYRTAFGEVRSLTDRLTTEKTQLRDTNRLLKASEEKYRSVVENIKEVIFQTDIQGNWTFVNRAWTEITGFSLSETLGRKAQEFVVLEDQAAYHAIFHSLLSSECEDCRREMRYRTREGGIRWIEVFARVAQNEGGEITGIAGTLFDITERKKAETELKALAVELQRSNRELSDFASVASHDLNEPLRKIIMFAERLKTEAGDQLNEDAHDFIERMTLSAFRMQSLIKGLLEYSRVASRAKPFQPIDLNEVFSEVLFDLEVAVDKASAKVTRDYLPIIQADSVQMRQLFQNMIGNALKFRNADVPPEIHIAVEPLCANGQEMVLLRFRDNGIGFDNCFREQIFEAFERLHSTSEYAGTGIGLAICRKIVERHNGWIQAESAPGKGSEFRVALPLQ